MKELDNLCIQPGDADHRISHTKVAARLLGLYIDEEVRNLGIQTFAASVTHGFKTV